MRTIYVLCVISISATVCAAMRFPAEWEPHSAIWLAWPTIEEIHGHSEFDVQLQMIEALQPHVAVKVIVNSDQRVAVTTLLSQHNLVAELVELEHSDVWMRDFGPIFVLDEEMGALDLLHFGFNCWGYEHFSDDDDWKIDAKVSRAVGKHMGIVGHTVDIVSEGGDREFNGQGTLIASSVVEQDRNPHLSLPEIEKRLRQAFNLTNVIWVSSGLADDEQTFRGPLPGGAYTAIGTGGHVDEFVRFVSPDTVLLAEVSEDEARSDAIAQITRDRMEANYNLLRNATVHTYAGASQPLTVLRCPVPPSIEVEVTADDDVAQYITSLKFLNGSRPEPPFKILLASSYLNFLVTNGVVLVPKYYSESRGEAFRKTDEEALAVFKRVFPDRKIVQIDPTNVNMGGGGMHCISQQQPMV